MRTVDTSCRTEGHPEFRLQVDETAVPEPDIRFFVEALEGWVQQGDRFVNGETVQLGWSVMRVRPNADGTLSLLEPDFVSLPIAWVDSVTVTLQHLRLHKDVCESFFDPDALECPSLRDSCIVCTQLSSAPQLVMERFADPDPGDSGWFIGCRDGAHDHNDAAALGRMSLYEAVLANRAALPFLGLPEGVLLETSDGQSLPRVLYEESVLSPKPGSYVEALGKR